MTDIKVHIKALGAANANITSKRHRYKEFYPHRLHIAQNLWELLLGLSAEIRSCIAGALGTNLKERMEGLLPHRPLL
jgi:hypothetical protein